MGKIMRMTGIVRLVLLSSAVLLFAACRTEWVQLTPEGQGVRVATPTEVANCTRAGTANVSALGSIGFVQRSARQLQDELIRLARNEAGDMQANRIVAESPIDEGRQTFGIYRCS